MQTGKTAFFENYLISIEDNGSILVLKQFGNGKVKESLRMISDNVGFKYDDSWTTREFGTKLVKEYGKDGYAKIPYGNKGAYGVKILKSGSIETYETYNNTVGALREIAEQCSFDFDASWNTRQFGKKLIDFLNNK